MKKAFLFLLLTFMVISVYPSKAQDSTRISANDFSSVCGTWYGKLTYLDYKSGKPYSMQANISIMRISKTNQFIFSNSYPNEPKANSMDTVSISADGKMIDQEIILSRSMRADGNTEVITELEGTDGHDNRPATIRHTYIIGMNDFIMRKEVKFKDSKDWILRHEYIYQREL
ncbi:hypothetical protein BH11BAC2_BH11BAC2_03560 [soil metagenome]